MTVQVRSRGFRPAWMRELDDIEKLLDSYLAFEELTEAWANGWGEVLDSQVELTATWVFVMMRWELKARGIIR